jgi:CBS domain-containing protein
VAALRASGNEEVRTVKPDVTVAEAIRRMRDELVGALVVSEDGTSILGIISDRGIVDALADHGVDVLKDRVRSVMTGGVLTCSADDRVGAIMAAMVARRIRHIPVVDEEGRLGGNVGAGMLIGGVAGAFYLQKPLFWGKAGIAIVGIALAVFCYSIGNRMLGYLRAPLPSGSSD